MRRVIGGLLIFAGGLLVLAGGVAAAWFGVDNTATMRSHQVDVHGTGLVTVPRAIAYAGPRVDVTAHAQETGQHLFAGVAHDVDVRDFLSGVARTDITSVRVPLHLSTKAVEGSLDLPADPSSLDIWIASAEGVGEVNLSFRLPDAADDVVILSTDARPVGSLTVSAALVVPGAFVGALAGVVLGAGLALVGWSVIAMRRRSRQPNDTAELQARL
jgi:hypothetical protein